MDPDHAEVELFGELNARRAGHAEDIAGPGQHIDSLIRGSLHRVCSVARVRRPRMAFLITCFRWLRIVIEPA